MSCYSDYYQLFIRRKDRVARLVEMRSHQVVGIESMRAISNRAFGECLLILPVNASGVLLMEDEIIYVDEFPRREI